MKRILISLLGLLACASLPAAESTNTPDAVKGAIAKLKAETNYSWTVNTQLPSMDFTPEPMQGQTEKDGFMLVSTSFGGNSMQAAFKGAKVAVKTEDQWEMFDENSDQPNMGWFLARTKSAGDEAADLAGKAKALKAGDGGLWSGDLTEDGAKDLLSFGPRRAGGDGPPPPKNAKATVKFWVKDGALAKYETHVTGTVDFGGGENEMEIIRTIDIHGQGKTKVTVPDEAKKKLEGK